MYSNFGEVWFKALEFSFFDPPPFGFFGGGGEFFKKKLSEITSFTTLLITEFAVELIV